MPDRTDQRIAAGMSLRWTLSWREGVGTRAEGPTIFEGRPIEVMPVAEHERLLDIAKGIGRVDHLALQSASETIVILKAELRAMREKVVI